MGTTAFTSLLKEITLKNSSSLAGFEPTNLGSNGKYDNHETTEDVKVKVKLSVCLNTTP
jgi:hypothetical protein